MCFCSVVGFTIRTRQLRLMLMSCSDERQGKWEPINVECSGMWGFLKCLLAETCPEIHTQHQGYFSIVDFLQGEIQIITHNVEKPAFNSDSFILGVGTKRLVHMDPTLLFGTDVIRGLISKFNHLDGFCLFNFVLPRYYLCANRSVDAWSHVSCTWLIPVSDLLDTRTDTYTQNCQNSHLGKYSRKHSRLCVKWM